MSTADKFFNQLISECFNNLHTSMPCTVIRYYPDGRYPKADLRPLFSCRINGIAEGYPVIKAAPVLRHVGELIAGDTVFVSFAERALDFAGGRRHDLTDAVVIGVM